MDLRLILILAATDAADTSLLTTIGSYAWPILSVAVGLGFVIFVHELGHFLVAKACGVKCEKFYIGFDWFPISRIGPFKIPTSLFKAKWGETVYGIGILPLGGYVKMLGQDDDPRNTQAEIERTKVFAEGTAAEGLTPNATVEKTELEKPNEPYKIDPRSYPAKPVPARMAIISAGVIMNAIFAVIFGAIAFKIGVDEMPAVIGAALPGDPAWEAGLRPGDKVLQFGKSGSPYEYLRWDDLKRSVIFNGADRDLPMLVRHSNGDEKWYTVRPEKKSGSKFATLGVAPARDVTIGLPKSEDGKPPRAQVRPALLDKDKVVEIAGQSVASGTELGTLLAHHANGPLKMRVERTTEPAAGSPKDAEAVVEKIDVVVEQRLQRYLGAVMEMGPIIAIQQGSPAETAGLKVGDTIEKVDGEPVGDPLTLRQRLIAKNGQSAVFTVMHSAKGSPPSPHDITVPLTLLPALADSDMHLGRGGPLELDAIGAAFRVERRIAAVDPNTPAAQAGLQAGDEIQTVNFIPANDKEQTLIEGLFAPDQRGFLAKLFGAKKEPMQPLALDDENHNWMQIHAAIQAFDPATKFEVTYQRAGKTATATLTSIEKPEAFDETRGLAFYTHAREHKAEGWSDAMQLGFRETKERLGEVLTVLTQLGSGRLSATNLSGPAGILGAAGSHANAGIAPLFLFLTLLSANLAIINFLPIPALDGGHMIFLIAEWVRGKPVDANLQMTLTLFGIACLLSLMVFATVMDIGRFMS